MKTLIVYLILSTVILNMVPNNNYRKIISLFSGLVLIVILVKPISYILNLDVAHLANDMDAYILEAEDNPFNMDISVKDYLADKPDYITLSSRETVIGNIEKLGFKVNDFSITWDRDKMPVRIIIRCTKINNKSYYGESLCQHEGIEDKENYYEIYDEDIYEIKKKIKDVYNIDDEDIYVMGGR